MNAYVKAVGCALLALAASAAVAARSAEPDVVIVPVLTMSPLMQYLNTRPYQEVAGLMSNLQRCLQDQIPDDKGVISERGHCPEIATALRQMKTPLPAAAPSPQ